MDTHVYTLSGIVDVVVSILRLRNKNMCHECQWVNLKCAMLIFYHTSIVQGRLWWNIYAVFFCSWLEFHFAYFALVIWFYQPPNELSNATSENILEEYSSNMIKSTQKHPHKIPTIWINCSDIYQDITFRTGVKMIIQWSTWIPSSWSAVHYIEHLKYMELNVPSAIRFQTGWDVFCLFNWKCYYWTSNRFLCAVV